MTVKQLRDVLNEIPDDQAESITLIDYEDNELNELIFNGYGKYFDTLTITIK